MTNLTLNILLIDSDETYSKLLMDHFDFVQSCHLETKITHSPSVKESTINFDDNQFDLIILDVNVPQQTTTEVMKQARATFLKTPIIVISSIHDKKTIKDILEHGANDYLIKGNYTLQQLCSSFSNAIGVSLNLAPHQETTDPLLASHCLKHPMSVPYNVLIITLSKTIQTNIENYLLEKNTHNQNLNIFVSDTLEKSTKTLEDHSINVIILDLLSQDHNAIRLMQDIRKQQHTTPLVVLATNNDPSIIKKTQGLLVLDYFYEDIFCCSSYFFNKVRSTIERFEILLKAQNSNREQVHSILNNCIESMIIISQDGIVEYYNDAAKTIFSQPEHTIIGTPLDLPIIRIEENATLDNTALSLKLITMMINTNTSLEIVLQTSDLSQKTMLCRASQILWDRNNAYLLAFHDITDIKRIAELKAEIQEKNHIEKVKDDLIGVISHELRTPLTIIKSAIGNLKDGIVGRLSDKQQHIINTTDRNVDRLARMINNLLDMSRLESGRANINRHEIKMIEIVNEVINGFQETTKKKNITITTQIPENLPTVYADSDMITQLLINLFNNAIRYTKTSIVISAHEEPPHSSTKNTSKMITLSVTDDGTGIAKENVDLIFDKFQQVGRTQGGSGYKGTGLGLAICKEIIDIHNGKIWVESKLGAGASFKFSLPQYDIHDDFLDAFELIIKKAEAANKNISVMILGIANLDEMMQQSTDKDIAWLFNDISKQIRNKALRTSDFFHFRRDKKEFILIFSGSSLETAHTISKRINNLTKDCFCPGKQGKIFVDLKVGISVFPEDAKTPKELIQHALQDMQKIQT